ncbi:hypothetical protein B1B04_04975 [Lysinibacillus sp. KCTC 33748]|uniref:hypothetical protein n=1 Tax=unclassified Lysinibacillus TaxID=2636778 RepID=UPI0009A834A3|nr:MULTISPECIES: hypothetical protein [unclassified Lysinibacillus]OXS76331.1 hypothetical protein B1B04_04975 [Lysinibacillus sp. KCTC 33748]SKB44090.1 hypothetical protein SAMN06295926_102477 [Lysinibacillus sp. AC-3]
MNYYKNKVAWCHLCNQGWVEIVQEKKTGNLLIACSECESMWRHPDDIKNQKKFTSAFDTTIEDTVEDEEDVFLIFESYVEIQHPTDKDVQTKKWGKYIIEN